MLLYTVPITYKVPNYFTTIVNVKVKMIVTQSRQND